MKITKENVLKIKELRSQGVTSDVIARELSISSRTVSYWVKRLKDAGHVMDVKTKKGPKALEL